MGETSKDRTEEAQKDPEVIGQQEFRRRAEVHREQDVPMEWATRWGPCRVKTGKIQTKESACIQSGREGLMHD